MAANTTPIFSLTPNIGMCQIGTTVANISSSGDGLIGTNLYIAFSAGSNGSFVQKARFYSSAVAAGTTGVATTVRLFLSSLSTGTTTVGTNTILLGEVSIPAINSANQTNATNFYDYPLNIALPASWYILVTQHLAQTTKQSIQCVVYGSNY